MAGKFVFPVLDSGDGAVQAIKSSSDAIATTLRELPGSVAGSILPVISYLTGANGSAECESSYAATFSANQQSDLWLDFDASVDPVVTITAPASGNIRCQIFGWVYVGVNAVNATAVGVNSRFFATLEILDASGARVSFNTAKAQVHVEVWGTNTANVVGMNSAAQSTISGLTPGAVYTVRARHGYFGYAHDGSSNVVAMPSGSWYRGTIGPLSIGVVPQ